MPSGHSAFVLHIQKITDDIRNQVEDTMQDIALDGEQFMKEKLLAEETDWGRARVAGEVPGPNGDYTPREHPGRYETGTMYDAVTSEVVRPDRNTWQARWGWPDDKFQDYFDAQDEGWHGIKAAESLQFSLDRAEDMLAGRLSGIV